MVEQRSCGPGSGGAIGCLLVPAGIGGLFLAVGLWLMSGWSTHGVLVQLLSLMLVAAGGLLVVAVGAVVLVASLLARFARNVRRDAKNIAWSMKYMMNAGRMEGTKHEDVVVEAKEITGDETKNDEKSA